MPMYWTTPSGTRYHTGLPPATRPRQSVEEIAIAGISCSEYSPWGRSSPVRSWPGRVTPTKCASCHSSSTSFHCRIWPRASAPVMKNSSARGFSRWMSWRVSIVYVVPPRSISTRETEKRGLEAVATTAIRYRCSARVTARSDLKGCAPVGTKMTSSSANSSATSLAATRCPWWIGSNVPPMIPIRVGSRVAAITTHPYQGGHRSVAAGADRTKAHGDQKQQCQHGQGNQAVSDCRHHQGRFAALAGERQQRTAHRFSSLLDLFRHLPDASLACPAHCGVATPPSSGADVSFTFDDPGRGGQLRQAHRPASMQLLGGDANLGTQAEFGAVGEPGGGVDHNRCRVQFGAEAVAGADVPSTDRLGMAGGVGADVLQGSIQVRHHPYCQIETEVFGVPVLLSGRLNWELTGQLAGTPIGVNDHVLAVQSGKRCRQELLGDLGMHQQSLHGVTDTDPLGFGVQQDLHGLGDVDVGVDVQVTIARPGLDHRHR